MKPMTSEWIAKAEGDFGTMNREIRTRRKPNYDDVCFHAQQCAEKYLKACMCEHGIPIAESHDLVSLHAKLARATQGLREFRAELGLLNAYGVSVRYPGITADRQAAVEAAKLCRLFRKAARRELGLT
jgi:HEPN domain-containing protein